MLWILLELEDNENAENIYRTVTATVIVRYFFINIKIKTKVTMKKNKKQGIEAFWNGIAQQSALWDYIKG